MAHEPIPKCVLPEVEVFLGEVPIAVYETPGGQKFADTILPYVKSCNTILLANHGTITFGPSLENAYFNTEIIDAYCRILILSRQLGRVNYFTDQQTKELLEFKKRLGYDDIRFQKSNPNMCGESSFDSEYAPFMPRPLLFEEKWNRQGWVNANARHQPRVRLAAASPGFLLKRQRQIFVPNQIWKNWFKPSPTK